MKEKLIDLLINKKDINNYYIKESKRKSFCPLGFFNKDKKDEINNKMEGKNDRG